MDWFLRPELPELNVGVSNVSVYILCVCVRACCVYVCVYVCVCVCVCSGVRAFVLPFGYRHSSTNVFNRITCNEEVVTVQSIVMER